MSEATHLARYSITHTTFAHMQLAFIINFLCSMNKEILKSSDIASTINRLHASSMSLSLVRNVGRSDDKRPYLKMSLNEVRLSEIAHSMVKVFYLPSDVN